MRNYNEWEDMIGTNGRYKIRLAEDNRTVEVMGSKGKRLIFTARKGHGAGHLYCTVYYEGASPKSMGAHQLSFKQWNDASYFPKGYDYVIDHEDSDPTNNNPTNLRKMSHRENCSRERTKKSGLPVGVEKLKNTRRYTATIWKGKKRYYLGNHDTPEIAHQVYREALHRINTLGHV